MKVILGRIGTNWRKMREEWDEWGSRFKDELHWQWKRPLHSIVNLLTEGNRWLPYIKSHTWDLLIIAIAIGGWVI